MRYDPDTPKHVRWFWSTIILVLYYYYKWIHYPIRDVFKNIWYEIRHLGERKPRMGDW